jgi:hypothetical protein
MKKKNSKKIEALIAENKKLTEELRLIRYNYSQLSISVEGFFDHLKEMKERINL